jgi:hypothetical protein
MNVNFGTYLLQCSVMGLWILSVAALYSIFENVIVQRDPDFLKVVPPEEDEHSTIVTMPGNDPARQA